jgi:hypothetical protein
MKTFRQITLAASLLLAATQAHAMRWYSPNTGRWFSRDPIEEKGGLNLYGFANNQCINQLDYLGMKVELEINLTRRTDPLRLTGGEAGKTTFDLGSIHITRTPCACPGRYKFKYDGKAVITAYFWPISESHEMTHVSLRMLEVEAINAWEYNECHAACWGDVIIAAFKASVTWGDAANIQFDANSYSNLVPDLTRQAAQAWQAERQAKQTLQDLANICVTK